MERVPVSSTALASVGYDVATRTLEVEYVSSGVYRYADVDPADVLRLLNADSMGAYMNTRIKPYHQYTEVWDE